MDKIRLLILILILWNLPGYFLAYWSATLGSLASYASSLLLLGYFVVIMPKHRLIFPFIALGILYFTFSTFRFSDENEIEFLKDFVRYMIVAVCAGEVVYRTKKKEIFYILVVGALSIIVNAVVFPSANALFYENYGRFSGFYLNPNFAGGICLIGYVLTYTVENKYIKYGSQFIFTLAGIFTFSRTFMVIWLLVNIIAIYQNKKNAMAPAIGGLVLVLVFALSSGLTLNTERFNALTGIFESNSSSSRTFTKDTRMATWSRHIDRISENPILGNGYRKLQAKKYGGPGVHNSYLMVLGEAGIIPFLVMIGIYISLIVNSFRYFKVQPHLFYMSCVLALLISTGHGYFTNFFSVLLSMYVFVELRKLKARDRVRLEESPEGSLEY